MIVVIMHHTWANSSLFLEKNYNRITTIVTTAIIKPTGRKILVLSTPHRRCLWWHALTSSGLGRLIEPQPASSTPASEHLSHSHPIPPCPFLAITYYYIIHFTSLGHISTLHFTTYIHTLLIPTPACCCLHRPRASTEVTPLPRGKTACPPPSA